MNFYDGILWIALTGDVPMPQKTTTFVLLTYTLGAGITTLVTLALLLMIANIPDWREVRLAFTLYIIQAFTSRIAFLARAQKLTFAAPQISEREGRMADPRTQPPEIGPGVW